VLLFISKKQVSAAFVFLLFNFVNGIMDFIKGKKRFLEIPGLQISY